MLHSRPSTFHAFAHTTIVGCLVAAGPVALRGGTADTAATTLPRTREPIVLNDNGAWSWFEDERAVVDPVADTLLVSSVASSAGTDGSERDGNVEVVAYDVATGDTHRSVLHRNLQANDHDSAAIYTRPDGRYVAMYSKHASDDLSRWRISKEPGDATTWEPERSFDHGARTTYSNLYANLGDDGQELLHAFVRSLGRDPTILVSADHGTTWRHSGRLLEGPGRPYVRYSVDSAGRIHLLTTEQHPLDFANGIYHGVIDNGQLQRSDGTVVDSNLFDDDAIRPDRLTTVFASGIQRAWTIDLQVDADGYPYAAFSVHVDGAPSPPADQRRVCTRHCYYYARFDGTVWRVHLMADAGSALSAAEPFYTGLVALHPSDPHRVFLSTDVHPATGAPLISSVDGHQHHELFEGLTTNAGATWTWTPITINSAADNIRPISPIWSSQHTALLWLRGTYTTYTNYDLDVVAILPDETEHDVTDVSRSQGADRLNRPSGRESFRKPRRFPPRYESRPDPHSAARAAAPATARGRKRGMLSPRRSAAPRIGPATTRA